VRFKKIDDVPLKAIGEAIRRVPAKEFIEHYESTNKAGATRAKPASGKKPHAARR
jgi:hypothetical protein